MFSKILSCSNKEILHLLVLASLVHSGGYPTHLSNRGKVDTNAFKDKHHLQYGGHCGSSLTVCHRTHSWKLRICFVRTALPSLLSPPPSLLSPPPSLLSPPPSLLSQELQQLNANTERCWY